MALHLIDGFSNSKNHLEETILWPLLDISLNLCFIHLLFISCISAVGALGSGQADVFVRETRVRSGNRAVALLTHLPSTWLY